MYLTIFLSLILAWLFIYIEKPMMLVLFLLIQSLILSSIIFFLSRTSWFSFNLILVYSSGMLVIFSYVTNIIPNMLNKGGFSMFFTGLVLMTIVGVMAQFSHNYCLDDIFGSLKHIFSGSCGLIMVMMISILFLSMLSTIKICSFSEGPLRLM